MEIQNQISQVIRNRRTWKVLGEVESPVVLSDDERKRGEAVVRQAVEDGAFAPFHYDRKLEGSVEPFRFHVLWHDACRTIARNFHQWFPDARRNNKLPSMLSACGALVLVTWLPERPWEQTSAKLEQVNEEHLAAASAAVQNVLLSLTAAGYGSYWSSGGQFRFPEMKTKLEIPEREKLLAAVFVEYPSSSGEAVERIPGKHHPNRSAVEDLVREIRGVA